MRSRAALLPYPGDPFLLNYWLKFFDEVWGEEVDKLYIYLNSPIEQPVVDYIRELCLKRPKINLQYNNVQVEHGYAIDRLLDVCTEEFIMLIEDDGFIFKKGLVNACFEALESSTVEVVGSKRGSCSKEILDRSAQLYGLDYSGIGDQGCNFWPNFFFCRKALLISTDRQFGARAWQPSELILWLSRPNDPYYAKELVTSDTFVNTSMQIQAAIPQNKIKYVNQYHGSPDDLEHSQRNYNLFDGIAGWCHIGSLSSGVGGLIQDGHGRSLARRLIDEDKGENYPIPNYCHTEAEKNEFERRVQWWLRFWQYAGENQTEPANPEMQNFYGLYKEGLDRIISEYQLNTNRIDRRQRAYAQIGL